MAGEVAIPLLPCGSVDEIAEFYAALGFEQTYRQLRPNPYVALRREDLHLHFFGMPDFDPAQSYGSCLVQVPDIGALHGAFETGMRAAYCKVLVSGIPRMTRPRKRKNAGNLSGFSLVDPGGNWIRITALPGTAAREPAPSSKLAKALDNAVVLADSKGDVPQALKILGATLAHEEHTASPEDVVEARAYLAELSVRLDP